MPKKIFPLQDLTTSTLPGERWVDMKGFRGIYQVSSLGRIRSVERKVAAMNRWEQNIKQERPGIIRKQKIRIRPSTVAKTPLYECGISLWKDNKETTMRVSRLVYTHFIGPLAKNLKVTHKDGDGRNNNYKNLMALDDSGIRRLAYQNGRQRNIFSLLTEAQKKKIYKKLSEKGKQPVQRISASGKVVKNFASIEEAAKDAPCDRNYMTHVLKGRKKHVKGKFYRYAPGPSRYFPE